MGKRIAAKAAPKRLAPEQRKEELLLAAIALLEREGLEGFSLEAVAREAGVALSLPRHYFGGYNDLLRVATESLLHQVESILLGAGSTLSMRERLSAYLDLLSKYPWGHQVWMRAAEIHPDIEVVVRNARRRISESMYRKPWRRLSRREQIHARGRIGYVESVVSDVLEREHFDQEAVVELIYQAIVSPGTSAGAQLTP